MIINTESAPSIILKVNIVVVSTSNATDVPANNPLVEFSSIKKVSAAKIGFSLISLILIVTVAVSVNSGVKPPSNTTTSTLNTVIASRFN